MPIFAFYPIRPDGSSLSFELVEFASEVEAMRHGEDVCHEHASCDHVVVWQDDQVIGRVWKHVPAL